MGKMSDPTESGLDPPPITSVTALGDRTKKKPGSDLDPTLSLEEFLWK